MKDLDQEAKQKQTREATFVIIILKTVINIKEARERSLREKLSSDMFYIQKTTK